jgi:3-deoxy-manno-octulosonate cytidylyltransferase (CMP-KDO synthetase)
MKILGIIPARMGSTRFPGKPMAEIHGNPMIGRVYENVDKCKHLDMTFVATCDEEIYKYIESSGGKVVMTSKQHERASDRCAEALLIIEKDANIKFDIVVMVQGDEPMINAAMISESLNVFESDPFVQITNLIAKIRDEEEFNDPNCIKVVCNRKGDAMFFSRKPIPHGKFQESSCSGKQVCVISFRRDYLLKYTKMQPTPLEIVESIDMLRILENGESVRMIPTSYQTASVDTKEDLVRVQKLISK